MLMESWLVAYDISDPKRPRQVAHIPIPPGVHTHKVRVENGLIRNDLDIEQQSGDEQGWVRGRLGKGGCPIRLRTSNGTISVR